MQYNMHADVTLKNGFSVCVCDDQREVNEKGCLLAALLVDAALLERFFSLFENSKARVNFDTKAVSKIDQKWKF